MEMCLDPQLRQFGYVEAYSSGLNSLAQLQPVASGWVNNISRDP